MLPNVEKQTKCLSSFLSRVIQGTGRVQIVKKKKVVKQKVLSEMCTDASWMGVSRWESMTSIRLWLLFFSGSFCLKSSEWFCGFNNRNCNAMWWKIHSQTALSLQSLSGENWWCLTVNTSHCLSSSFKPKMSFIPTSFKAPVILDEGRRRESLLDVCTR